MKLNNHHITLYWNIVYYVIFLFLFQIIFHDIS